MQNREYVKGGKNKIEKNAKITKIEEKIEKKNYRESHYEHTNKHTTKKTGDIELIRKRVDVKQV